MSAHEIVIDGGRYLSAGAAAAIAGRTRDYMGRLCREGKVPARRIGNGWYIEKKTLESYLVERAYHKEKRDRQLSEVRTSAYRTFGGAARSRSERVPRPARKVSMSAAQTQGGPAHDVRDDLHKALVGKTDAIVRGASDLVYAPGGFTSAAFQATHLQAHTISPLLEFMHKVTALFFTLVLLVSVYEALNPASARFAIAKVRGDAASVSRTYWQAQDSLTWALGDPYTAAAVVSLAMPEAGRKAGERALERVDQAVASAFGSRVSPISSVTISIEQIIK